MATFRAGLPAPALLSIAKDVLLGWVVIAALLVVAMSGGWGEAFRRAGDRFAATPSGTNGLLLSNPDRRRTSRSSWAPPCRSSPTRTRLTTMLVARDRATVQRNAAALPVYCLVLELMATLGFFALAQGVTPQDGDLNTVIPRMFNTLFPSWSARMALAAFGIAALIPAAVMSIAAANA